MCVVEVSEILLGDELYQRQLDAKGDVFSEAVWFIAEGESWVWVTKEANDALEARYQEDFYPAPEAWTEEDRQDALCEQMASDDYETSVYG